jgi:L-alanine-DL-glutamate epimerase-like enolase superfamily enzyme
LLPSISSDLAAAMRAFDDVWFGEHPARPEDAALARRVAEAIPRAPIERGALAGLAAPQ